MKLGIKQTNNIKPRTGVFVDNSNIFYAQKKSGWKVDFQKLKDSLSLSLDLKFIKYYAAIPAEWDVSHKPTLKYFEKIKNTVSLKTKQIKYIYAGKKVVGKKGDLDLELALDVVRDLDKLDIVIVMSGDSDYLELKNFVMENNKKIIFLGFDETMAWEIRRVKHLLLNSVKSELELGGQKITPEFYLGRLLLDLLYSNGKKSQVKNNV